MTALIALTILTASVPPPARGFWLGAAAVSRTGGAGNIYYYLDGHGQVSDSLVILVTDGYNGLGILAGYTPADWVRFQMTLLELRLQWTGTVAVALAPAVGLDVQFEPPVPWRVRPYAWAGGSWTSRLYTAVPPNTWVVEPLMVLRAGPGVTVRVNPRLGAFAEVDFLGVMQSTEVDTRSKSVVEWEQGWLAASRARAGIRYILP
jgi:hypothetical protein